MLMLGLRHDRRLVMRAWGLGESDVCGGGEGREEVVCYIEE